MVNIWLIFGSYIVSIWFLHGIPSGQRLQKKTIQHHHAINVTTHYFDWAIFNSYVKSPEGMWDVFGDALRHSLVVHIKRYI